MNPQDAAVHSEGPTLVIAGPGTGKTYTLIQRVLYLICEKQVKPEEIMLVTYTVKAAKELTTRLTGEFSKRGIEVNLHEMYIGTFHHICRLILKEFREYTTLPRNFLATDQFEQQYLVYEALEEFEKIPRFHTVVPDARPNWQGGPPLPISRWKQAGKVCTYVNGLSEELLDPEAMIREHGGELGGRVEVLARMLLKYNRMARERNFTDFARLQTETYELLTHHPEVLMKLRRRIRYVMVDEYQDTDFIQEKLARLFAGESGNLFVVGDDDQSLYRFRGATVDNILHFADGFHGRCHRYNLNTNYRSNKGIIQFCRRWMGLPALFSWTDETGQEHRYRKGNIYAAQPGGQQSVVRITANNDPKIYGERVADFVLSLKQEGHITDYNQVAFLFDSVKGKEAALLMGALQRHGISVYAPRAGHFFDRKEVALLLGMLLLLFPEFSTHMEQFQELSETEGIEERYMAFMGMAEAALENPDNAELLSWKKKKEGRLSEKPEPLLTLVYELLSLPPFRGWIDRAAAEESQEARNLSTITRLVSRFDYFLSGNHGYGKETVEDVSYFFARYLRLWIENGVGEYEDEEAYAPSGCVSFLNIHQSKGLEYPVVVAASLYDYPRGQDDLAAQVTALVTGRRSSEPPKLTRYFDFQRKYYTAFSRAETLLVLACNRKGDKVPTDAFRGWLDHLPEYDSGIDYGALQFRPIAKNTFKPRFAFTTQVALYEECPLKYRWLRYYRFAPSKGIAALYGLLVHETIEDVHRAILRGEGNAISPGTVYGWMMADYITLSQRENTWLSKEELDRAFSEIMGYVSYRARAGSVVENAEFPLELVTEDYIIDGTIDLLEGNGETVDILDFKTGKRPDAESPRMQRYRSQLMVYAFLVEQKLKRKVGRLILYFTGEDDPLTVLPMEESLMQERMAAFDRTARAILAGDFTHKAERKGKALPEACRYCDWKRYCWGREDS